MLVQATLLKTGGILLQHVGLVTVCSMFASLFKVDCDSVKKTLESKIKIEVLKVISPKSGKHVPGSLLW